MLMLQWLKSKWRWLLGAGLLLLALLAGRRATKQDISIALAKKRLIDATQAWQASEKRAEELKARSQYAAEEYAAEKLAASARQEQINGLSDDAVRAELERRGYK